MKNCLERYKCETGRLIEQVNEHNGKDIKSNV